MNSGLLLRVIRDWQLCARPEKELNVCRNNAYVNGNFLRGRNSHRTKEDVL